MTKMRPAITAFFGLFMITGCSTLNSTIEIASDCHPDNAFYRPAHLNDEEIIKRCVIDSFTDGDNQKTHIAETALSHIGWRKLRYNMHFGEGRNIKLELSEARRNIGLKLHWSLHPKPVSAFKGKYDYIEYPQH